MYNVEYELDQIKRAEGRLSEQEDVLEKLPGCSLDE